MQFTYLNVLNIIEVLTMAEKRMGFFQGKLIQTTRERLDESLTRF